MTTPTATATENKVDPMSWARLGGVALLGWLAWSAFHDEYGTIPLLSGINLAIHEAGHILFMPFGETMTILGGSLFQVVFPLVFVSYFLWKKEDGTRRDAFAAMLCLWWVSTNILGVAIYCADSRAGQLMLVNGQTGAESDGHDWYNLLERWLTNRDIGGRMRAVATLSALPAPPPRRGSRSISRRHQRPKKPDDHPRAGAPCSSTRSSGIGLTSASEKFVVAMIRRMVHAVAHVVAICCSNGVRRGTPASPAAPRRRSGRRFSALRIPKPAHLPGGVSSDLRDPADVQPAYPASGRTRIPPPRTRASGPRRTESSASRVIGRASASAGTVRWHWL